MCYKSAQTLCRIVMIPKTVNIDALAPKFGGNECNLLTIKMEGTCSSSGIFHKEANTAKVPALNLLSIL